MSLIVACRQEADESEEGFALRHLAANGYVQRPWVVQRELSRTAIKKVRPSREDGQMVQRTVKTRSTFRVCPRCMADREVHLWLWTLKPFAACPIHGCLLVSCCSRCQAPFRWSRARLASCVACALPFRDMPACEADGRTIALCHLIEHGRSPEWLPASKPDGGWVTRAAAFFGIDPKEDWRSQRLSVHSIDEANLCAQRAWEVLEEWPTGLFAWLEARQRTVADRRNLSGFGNWLYRLRDALGDHEQTMQVANRFFAEVWSDLPIKSDSAFAAARSERDHVYAAEAAKILGVTSKTVVTMVEDGRLDGYHEPQGARQYTLVKRRSIYAYLRSPLLPIGLHTAAKSFGVSAGQVRALVRAGCLAQSRAGRASYVNNAALQHLLSALVKRCRARHGDDVVTSLVMLPRMQGVLLSDVVGRILAGTLPCYRCTGEGLAGFGVCLADVMGFRGTGTRELCSLKQASRRLGLTQRMVPILVERGCLEAILSRKRIAVRSISMASIAEFHREYISGHGVAALWSTNTRTAIGRMLAAGVKPIVAHDTSRGISSIWRRSDIDTATLDRGPADPAVRVALEVAKRSAIRARSRAARGGAPYQP
jgi:hypothetical protein